MGTLRVLKSLEKLMPQFMIHQHKNIENLEKFLVHGNFHEIARLGHIIKGSAGGYGFSELIEIGNEVELAAQNQDHARTELSIVKYREYIMNIKFVFVETHR
ncbi:MAG: hypothetical protein A4S09_03215 [Proteobacteria bacterium SG_bin7]|nr:MAG: hypothetical protein A4S09_03215 [Proteobacteria bacterium SG_bin7]